MAVNRFGLLLRRIWSLPNDLLCIFGCEGSWRLVPPIDAIAEHFLASQPEGVRQKILWQLSQPFILRLYTEGRINTIYHYDLDPESLIEYARREELILFQVDMYVDGAKQKANVEIYEGRLFSIQLRKPIKFYRNKAITFGNVKLGSAKQSYTRALDRLEHGRGESD